MRIQTIKPAFFQHEALASLAPAVRVMFTGMWRMTDHRQNLKEDHAAIKSQAVPNDYIDIGAALSSLEGIGLITRAGGFIVFTPEARKLVGWRRA